MTTEDTNTTQNNVPSEQETQARAAAEGAQQAEKEDYSNDLQLEEAVEPQNTAVTTKTEAATPEVKTETQATPNSIDELIVRDIQILLNNGASKEDVSRYLSRYDKIDFDKFSEQELLEIKYKGEYPNWSDEKVREHIEGKYGTNKVLINEAAESARKMLKEKQEEELSAIEKDFEPYRSEYERTKEVQEANLKLRENINDRFTKAVTADELSVGGVRIKGKALSKIGDALRPYFEDNSFLISVFQDKDGNFNVNNYLDAVLRYKSEMIGDEIASVYKKNQDIKLKAKYTGEAANINTKGTGGDQAPKENKRLMSGNPEDIRKAMKDLLAQNHGRLPIS